MSSSITGFDIDFGISQHPSNVFASIAMDGDEYVRCSKCGHGGCDVRVSSCGCTLHARCLPLNPHGSLLSCPQCYKPTDCLVLFPMSFREIDDAHKAATSLPSSLKNRGRKRKGGPDEPAEVGTYISDRRTGRWTTEEMTFCDKLIEKFESGEIPVEDGAKLNEFLGNMLKSKQSRLTKKMKNAKLSTRLFKRSTGHLQPDEARMFSELEESFFQAIQDLQERAEIKFHMQKEWREQFNRVCAALGQPLDADAWLNSVEEMDRRASQARNAARAAKRKVMMGYALRADVKNPDQGVFIEKTDVEARAVSLKDDKAFEAEFFPLIEETREATVDMVDEKSGLHQSAPFLARATSYLQRHNVPFEHIDLWVPSYVPVEDNDEGLTTCRLCYAGSATVDKILTEDGRTTRPLSQDEQFNFFAFGDYSQKFSFDVGCGLPGRVYESGHPTWEQSVHNAPHNHFERCGGASQWGIKTVIGLPIASPNVGRIVVGLYSCFDRLKDEELVARLSEEFTKLMPSPKWKLVVDIGDVEPSSTSLPMSSIANDVPSDIHADQDIKDPGDFSLLAGLNGPQTTASVSGDMKDNRIHEVISILGEFTPSDPNSPLTAYLSGFMTLRLLLLRQSRTPEEDEFVKTMLDSYSSYAAGGRDRADIAVMLARDCMFLAQQQVQMQGQPFLSLGHNVMNMSAQNQGSGTGLSVFGLPSISSSLQNSPALFPIPVPGGIDALSIVSN